MMHSERCVPYVASCALRARHTAHCPKTRANYATCNMQRTACNVQHATKSMQRAACTRNSCVSSVVFCAGMLDAEVVRPAVCRAACGAFILHVGMLLLMPVACCMLHAASLSLHLQRKLRTLHRARDSVAYTEQRCAALVCRTP
jgi:hypothetical protein